MKVPSNYNYEFSVKDYRATKSKHSPQIRRIQESGVKYDNIIDDRFIDDVTQVLVSKPWFYDWFRQRIQKQGYLSKSDLRELKTAINGATRTAITGSLGFGGFPESWTTAFYIIYYKRINAFMTKMTKEVIRDFL